MTDELNALEVYGVAIKSEIEAARAYEKMATLVESRDGKRKLRFLRDEEKKHRKMLEGMYRKEYPDVKLILPVKGLAPKLSAAVEKNTSLTKLFELAMEAEKGAEEFYRDAASKSRTISGRRLLNYLAGMEHGHYFLLKSEYDLMNEFDRFSSYKQFSTEHIGV